MIEVKRKKGETFDAMLRRFQRRFQQSGKLIESKRRRFHDSGKNKNQRRDGALRREQMRSEYDYKQKTGQLKEDPKKKKRSFR
jgi:ribosomal protein S21